MGKREQAGMAISLGFLAATTGIWAMFWGGVKLDEIIGEKEPTKK